jgi:hypothetical protein
MRIFIGITERQTPDACESRVLACCRQISDVNVGMDLHTANCNHYLPVRRGGNLSQIVVFVSVWPRVLQERARVGI